MNTRIEILSPRLANQIAAGEVVERPSSVIKELLENALDAGATRIDIDVERGGVQLLRVSDNGQGIHPDDLPLALARHATSKIKTLDDLSAVLSLGFRGEALASIASVSKLTLISRQQQSASAWLAFAEGAGMKVEVRPAALEQGTRVEVRDLFFNTPARRRFLRSENTEFAHIDETVKRVALARPDVAIKLTHNGKTMRHFRAGNGVEALQERVGAILGRSFLVTAAYADVPLDKHRLHGWVGHPEQHRAQADGQFVFVNGRAIRDRVVTHAIRAAYDEQLPKGRAPCFALFLDMPPNEVDVNVHPTKHEVRFRQARWVHDWLTQVVRDALTRLPMIDDSHSTQAEQDKNSKEENRHWHALSPAATRPFTSRANVPLSPTQVRDELGFYQASTAVHFAAKSGGNISFASAGQLTQKSEQHAANSLLFVAQDLCLQMQETPKLWRTDLLLQHYVHAQWWSLVAKKQTIVTQALLMPLPVQLAEEKIAKLKPLGFEIHDGLLLRAPAALKGCDWNVLLSELLQSDNALINACVHLQQQKIAADIHYWQGLIDWVMHSEHDAQTLQQLSCELGAQDWVHLWQHARGKSAVLPNTESTS